jgi:AraC-like DNA-binding protein
MKTLYREITPLTPNDCFTVFRREKQEFNFPLHYHDDVELNFIFNASGAKRVVGDHVEVIDDLELVLVGSNLPHAWFTHLCQSSQITEITIQFHNNLLEEKFLQRNQLSFIRTLLERSSRGISFSRETKEVFRPRLEDLTQKSGFGSVLELLSILHDLSISCNSRTLSASPFSSDSFSHHSRRVTKAYSYMQSHYDKDVTLADVAREVNMPEVSFSRFIKKRTGKTFVESLNGIRLGHASRLLIDTTETISEISYKCGFNNLSYFNRVFRKKNGCTPKEFRQAYSGSRLFV